MVVEAVKPAAWWRWKCYYEYKVGFISCICGGRALGKVTGEEYSTWGSYNMVTVW